ncbi:MAG: hypothetical protein J6Q45_04750 [Alistipes sp.]|nr:hypothetical protein [Alistipes sp.]
MKDTIITAQVKRRELWVLLACFLVANIINVVAIIRFSTPWYEVFTQIGYVCVTTIALYFLLALVRVVWKIFKYISRK